MCNERKQASQDGELRKEEIKGETERKEEGRNWSLRCIPRKAHAEDILSF